MIDPRDLPDLSYQYAPAFGGFVSGYYYQATMSQGTATTATSGVGVLRVAPMYVGHKITLAKLAAEVTVIGDAGSLVRICIYADNGSGYPGSLVLDAGTIPGDSVAVSEITVTQKLTPGLYWVGLVVQNVTTTQPTIRTATSLLPGIPIPITTGAVPTGAQLPANGYVCLNVTGAAPSTFAAGGSTSSVLGRVLVKAA
jgi:hypothetical protein